MKSVRVMLRDHGAVLVSGLWVSYIHRMRHVLLPTLIAAMLILPAQAEDAPDIPRDAAPAQPLLDFFGSMLRDFMTEIEPQIRELERGLDALEPEVQGFLDRMRGMAQYHPPEVLPNGDILIRRRSADDPALDPDDPAPEPKTEGSESAPFEI